MKKTMLLVLAASLAAIACGSGVEDACGGTDCVTQKGAAPARTDEVLGLVSLRCGRPLDGALAWTTDPSAERILWDTHGFDITLARPAAGDVTCSSLGSALAHYCLQTDSDADAVAWASRIYEFLYPHVPGAPVAPDCGG